MSQVGLAACGPATTTSTYAAAVTYAPHGAPTQYSMGNNIWRQASYNSRLQMSSFIDSVNNQTSNELLNATLNWGTTQNNGNLMGSTYNNGGAAANNGGISYPTFLSFTQGYIYDGVNRLNTVEEWNSSTSPEVANYSRSFAYDSYGNMFVSYASADLPPAGNTPTSYIFNSNNQFTNATYDDAGNELTANGNKINYDAESRQTSVVDVATGINELYLYDGEGKRVAKQTYGGTPTTVFAYDALGRMAAEYSTSVDTPTCMTCYLSPDHLGTARLVTDQSGIVVARHDYLPFGEEIPANIVGRNSQWGSGNDSINEKFTGKERDSESGLDYFGARYYGSALGRFTSPDWSAKPVAIPYANLADPQSFNLYSYVRNNPLSKADVDGHCTPPKLKDGQVGVCIDTYIQARTVPVAVPGAGLAFGDGRGPASNDKNATYRQEVQLVITPGGKPQMVKNDGGGSIAESFGIVVSGKGQSNTTVSDPTTDKSGTEHFNVSSTRLNGLASLPFAPKDTIKTSLNFSVTADGKVGLDAGGTRTAYPSIEVYSYGSDGGTHSLLQRTESGHIDDLQRQNQSIPAVSPQ